MRRDPSSWWTTTLLAHYGPQDRTHYDVLQAVDSFDRGDSVRKFRPTLEQLACRARLRPTAVKRALRELEDQGWLTVAHARGRGNINHYWVNRARLERLATADLKQSPSDPFSPADTEVNSRPVTLLGAENGPLTPVKGSPSDHTEWKGMEKDGNGGAPARDSDGYVNLGGPSSSRPPVSQPSPVVPPETPQPATQPGAPKPGTSPRAPRAVRPAVRVMHTFDPDPDARAIWIKLAGLDGHEWFKHLGMPAYWDGMHRAFEVQRKRLPDVLAAAQADHIMIRTHTIPPLRAQAPKKP